MELVDTEVNVRPLCWMSIMVVPDGPVDPPAVRPAEAPVKVTVPKLAKGT